MAEFDWQCQPQAENWLQTVLQEYLEKSPFIQNLEKELLEKSSTRLFDWIDHLTVQDSSRVEEELKQRGFVQETVMPTYRVFTHPGAKLPSILLTEGSHQHPEGIAIKVEQIADFLMVRGMEGCIEGSPFSPYRRCLIAQENQCTLFAVERRGYRTMDPYYSPESYLDEYLTAFERWKGRARDFADEEESMRRALLLAEEMVGSLGRDIAAWIVLDAERQYWQMRNTAAQLQKSRQDRLGMGWANHDHHTFRSSRHHFASLVKLFEILGFYCRERYHAGAQAGWGAQVMENTSAGLVLFLDVDLAAEEVEIDFAHHPLPERESLATVGLWCGLHGDSILKAGMHHLEAQFDFNRLREDLQIGMMEPFSDFSYLKQAFTKGEQWFVSPKRLEKLVQKGQITHQQADQFLKEGAIGSHLENLQRREGYKGFNKDYSSNTVLKLR